MNKGFIEQNLLPDEKIAYRAEIHWMIFFPSLIWFFVSLIIFFFGTSIFALVGTAKTVFSAIFCLLSIYNFGKAYLHKCCTELAITNRRMMAKFGFIQRHTIEIPLLKVESVLIGQSILERIVDSGSVAVRGTGSAMAPVRFIDQPVEFRNHLNQAIADARKKYSAGDYHGGPEQQ